MIRNWQIWSNFYLILPQRFTSLRGGILSIHILRIGPKLDFMSLSREKSDNYPGFYIWWCNFYKHTYDKKDSQCRFIKKKEKHLSRERNSSYKNFFTMVVFELVKWEKKRALENWITCKFKCLEILTYELFHGFLSLSRSQLSQPTPVLIKSNQQQHREISIFMFKFLSVSNRIDLNEIETFDGWNLIKFGGEEEEEEEKKSFQAILINN